MCKPDLSAEQIFEIQKKAIAANLADRRNLLFLKIPREWVAWLTVFDNPASQVLGDLNAMNDLEGRLIGDVIPLERWLLNAAALVATQPQLQKYFRDLAESIAAKFAEACSPGTAPAVDVTPGTKLERYIFRNDLLDFGFFARGVEVGKSVARLTVPRLEDGAPAYFPNSNQPALYFGTGWLLGPSHLITNYHVVCARDDWEARPSEQDLELQAVEMTVEFDYNNRDAAADIREIEQLEIYNEKLDYAIVRLKKTSGREPLTLQTKALSLPVGAIVPVNIIQHPGGGSKQIGIRNNLVAKLEDVDLAYYTDTEGGSSGSPVCGDDWKVIGLHKASTQRFRNLNFQGKSTAWVNIGTRIDVIITDLNNNHSDLWKAIAPKLA